jgi:4-hydroxy-3-polyprenylbenzoate decarboxylase
MKMIVGVSGASGIVLAERLLEALKKAKAETHLVVSETAEEIRKHEGVGRLKADYVYNNKDFFGKIASGSFRTDGMVVIPCSMKTLAGIASGYTDNLLLRAADVCLKERRKLVIVARETPLSAIHIENMLRLSRAGAIIMPPVMGFYYRPKAIGDMVDHTVGKVLDLFGIENKLIKRWEGKAK